MSLPIFDAVSEGLVGYDPNCTYSHTVTGNNCYLLALAQTGPAANTSDKVTGVTYNGVPMTRLGISAGPGSVRTYAYGLKIPVGDGLPHDVVWTFNSSDVGMNPKSISFSNVDQTTPIPVTNFFQDAGNGGAHTTSIAAPANSMVVDYFVTNDPTNANIPNAGQTQIGVQSSVIQTRGSASYKANATGMGWTYVGDKSVAQVVVAVAGLAAAATIPDAPTIGAASVTGATTASVNGTAPTNNGGAAIDNYRATLSPSGLTFTSTTLPVPCTGLTTGTAQTARLEAHNSAGWSSMSAASNSFTPTNANQTPTFGGTIANITGTVGVPITPVNISSLFTDAGDTKAFSASIGGVAWPNGLVVDPSTGIISGTPTAAATTTGAKVRDTDSGGLFVDSNSFNFVIAAVATNKTYTSLCAMKRINGDPVVSTSMTAIVSLPDGTYLGTKTGVITNSSGVPAPFTGTFGTAGTVTRIVWVEEASPNNPCPTENVTPT